MQRVCYSGPTYCYKLTGRKGHSLNCSCYEIYAHYIERCPLVPYEHTDMKKLYSRIKTLLQPLIVNVEEARVVLMNEL